MYEEFDENCIGDNGKTLPKGGPGGLRRELFELPEGCFELAGALLDALGAPGALRGYSGDLPGIDMNTFLDGFCVYLYLLFG